MNASLETRTKRKNGGNSMSQGEQSIWGAINTTLEIALNVYYLVCENGSGIKMSAAAAGKSAKLKEYIQMGDRDGDDLYFAEGSPIYQKVREAVEQAEAERQSASQEAESSTPEIPAQPVAGAEEQACAAVEPRETPPEDEDADIDDDWDGLEP